MTRFGIAGLGVVEMLEQIVDVRSAPKIAWMYSVNTYHTIQSILDDQVLWWWLTLRSS